MLRFNLPIGTSIQLRVKSHKSPAFLWKLFRVLSMTWQGESGVICCEWNGSKFAIPSGMLATVNFHGHTVRVGFVKKHGPKVAEMMVEAPKCVAIQRDGFIGLTRGK